MTNQHVPDRVVEHRVVRREDRPAGIPEDGAHALADQAFPDDLRAGAFTRHYRQCARWANISQIDGNKKKKSEVIESTAGPTLKYPQSKG